MPLPELDLLDFKRRVHALYARVRADPDPARGFAAWVAERDDLYAHHPQSALPPERRDGFGGLAYFDHDPAGRVLADVVPAEHRRYDIGASTGDTMAFDRVAVARFALGGEPCELELYWLAGYGGGLFVPFADATAGEETYGAGRIGPRSHRAAAPAMPGATPPSRAKPPGSASGFPYEASTWRSPIRTGIARRFAGGARGHAQRGSYEHDGLYARLKSSTSPPSRAPRSAPLTVSSR